VLLIFWCACAVFTARVASSRGRSPIDWGVAGFFFGPIALLAIGFMPPLHGVALGQVQETAARATSALSSVARSSSGPITLLGFIAFVVLVFVFFAR
jgi:hypothetical protein